MRDVGGALASHEPRGPASPAVLAAVGAAAVLLGGIGRVAVASALSEPLAASASGALTAAVWIVARYIIFVVLARRSIAVERRAVTLVWARAALPYLIALTGSLRAVAFALSAVIAYRSFVASGLSPRRATSMCGWAYGGEAAAVFVGWIVTNGLVVLPFLSPGS